MNFIKMFFWFFNWIDSILPVQCVYCNRIIAKKSAKYERTQIDALVPLCPSCHKLLYNPWSDDE